MLQKLDEKALKEKLKNITIIIDTRENQYSHLIEYFDKKKIPYIRRKLDIGDYSFEIDGISYEDEIVVERKNSLDEIAGNFTVSRERFENEFLRAKANDVKVFLVIENASWDKIKSGEYQSQLKPQSFLASLLSWQTRYNITINFGSSQIVPDLIYATFYYYAREKLQ